MPTSKKQHKPLSREEKREKAIDQLLDNIAAGQDKAVQSIKALSDIENLRTGETGLTEDDAKALAGIAERWLNRDISIDPDTLRAILSVLETHPKEELEQRSIFLDSLRHQLACHETSSNQSATTRVTTRN